MAPAPLPDRPDPRTEERLTARGLEARIVPADDTAAADAWLQSVSRGFLDAERTTEDLTAAAPHLAHRRRLGVYDPTAPVPDAPVATFASWIGELTVPGGGGIPAFAISSVTVSSTHRRQGIARAMMEGELHAAADAGIPVAVLTVSESTIYARYGFGSAADSAQFTIDATRARWAGPVPEGRVHAIPRERWRELAEELHERVRLRDAGELTMPHGHWERFAGTRGDVKEPGSRRAVQYTDAAGDVQGVAIYRVTENTDDFARSSLSVQLLLAATDDAYAALWRFVLEHDLIGEVRADQLSVGEPLRWMISDMRGATVTVTDHQYVRILDLPTALAARRYATAGKVRLQVADPLGYAEGTWVLAVGDDGVGSVERGDGPADVTLSLGVSELSSLYLGGVSVDTLVRAGRVQATDVVAAGRIFGWHRAPRLSFWY